MAMGRPTSYTPELAVRICELVALHATSLEKICAMYDEMPNHDTIRMWKIKYPDFSAMYYAAKEEQADTAADHMWNRVQNVDESKDAIAKASLELKFTQWQNARLAPKRWRESTQTESKVDVNVHEADLKALK